MKQLLSLFVSFFAFTLVPFAFCSEANPHWVGAWVASPQSIDAKNLPPAPGLADQTLRQIIQVTLAGTAVRVTFSNTFGNGPLTITSAHIAHASSGAAIQTGTDQALTFNGDSSITLQAGALMISDPVPFTTAPLTNLAVTIHLGAAPSAITGHPASHTTSFIQIGDQVSAPDLPGATRIDHWYFLTGLDVVASPEASALITLGDSITDGTGSTTNLNDRWPDQLLRRLQKNPHTAHIAVLNQGTGGNRVLRDGNGPNALSRFDRDVLAQTGVRWVVVLEGVNDIGTAVGARAKGESAASAQDLITAYRQLIVRAHNHGIKIYGATIVPFGGFAPYSTPESEADRQKVNQWIRTPGNFDGAIDFDAATRDPANPAKFIPAFDHGDHLHPSPAGYQAMADAIDLALFDSGSKH